jgi:multidrug resistance efflux pump
VASSAQSAREVSGRVDSLGQEAADSAERAERMRASADAAAAALESVRGTMVRTVRECSEAVERRQTRRFPMDLPAKLQWAGREQEVTLLDLSEGGAGLAGVPGLVSGTPVTLQLRGVAGVLTARVVEADQKRMGLAFQLAPAQQEALRAFLATQRRVAA